jgi:hypothetical protein
VPTSTTNFTLNKPLVNNATDQDLWGGYLNDNFDTIDSTLKTARDFLTRSISGADTATSADRNKFILVNASGGVIAPVLPSSATVGAGFQIAYKKTDSSGNAVTVTRAGAETIDGSTTYVLSGQNDSVCFVADGTNWYVKAYKTTPQAVASASDSVQGIVELATTAETQAGASSALAVTPAGMAAALGFKTYYESAEQSLTANTAVTLTHGLGSIPKLMQVEFVCKTTDIGYAVNDRVTFATYNLGSNSGISSFFNATQAGLIVGTNMTIIRKDTGVQATITYANWRAVVRAWA